MISIVIAVLNSHEVVRRQLLYFKKMPLPNDVELLLVDDGSDPPIEGELDNLRIFQTNDFRPWTQPQARNIGVNIAQGDYVICTDIDHIISKKLIDFVKNNINVDNIRFSREVGIIDKNGDFTQNMDVMRKYGLLPERDFLRLPPHGNSYAIKKDLFLKLGGSKSNKEYPNRDEIRLKSRLNKLYEAGEITMIKEVGEKPTIYMFPNGQYCGDKDYNPFGLFHDLKR
jgi:glycosyltransferase involved in cell wall biosynthesis